MFGRVVNSVRKKLSYTLKVENQKNLWQNLLKIQNERSLKLLSEFERINYKEVIDERELNPCVLRVKYIPNSATIEDIAQTFPNSVFIAIEKSRSNKSKTAFIGFESESESIKAFIASNSLEINGIKIVVIFADILFEKKDILKSDSNYLNSK